MTQSRLKSLSAAVTAAGLKYRLTGDGIMVDTNYTGPYPTEATWSKISVLNGICRRRNLAGNTAAMCTGFHIREWDDYRAAVLASMEVSAS